MRVELADERAVLRIDDERRVVLAIPPHLRARDDCVGVLVFRQGPRPLRGVRVLGGLYRVHEVGRVADEGVAHVGDEAGVHLRAVLVGDGAGRDDVADALVAAPDVEVREVWRKEEEVDALRDVERGDFPDDRKGRVVDYHAPRGVAVCLVVAARPERAHDLAPAEVVFAHRPVAHRLVDVRRRVAVVGCLARLELVEEAVVVEECVLFDAHAMPLLARARRDAVPPMKLRCCPCAWAPRGTARASAWAACRRA